MTTTQYPLDTLTIIFPGQQLDQRLTGNGRYARGGKIRLTKQYRNQGRMLALNALGQIRCAGDPQRFLTRHGLATDNTYPVTMVCRRYYSGPNKRYDDDNLQSAFKPFRDGVCDALEIRDDAKHLVAQYEQVLAGNGLNYLEIVVRLKELGE
jgi:hypothetical protein